MRRSAFRARRGAGGEARHRVAENVRARQTQGVHRPTRDEESVVESNHRTPRSRGARYPSPAPLWRAPEPGSGTPRCTGRRAQRDRPGRRETSPPSVAAEAWPRPAAQEPRRPESPGPRVGANAVAQSVKAGHPHALLCQQLHVYIGDGDLVDVREPLRLGEQDAVLVDEAVAVPRQIGRRLSVPRWCTRTPRAAAPRHRDRHSSMSICVLADRDVARRHVHQQRGARHRRSRGRRKGHPHVLADLHVHAQPRHALKAKQEIGAEGHLLAEHLRRGVESIRVRPRTVASRRTPVVRQIALRHHAERTSPRGRPRS